MTSPAERPRGSKSEPPLAPPIGIPVSEFLNTCSKPRNLMMPWYAEGWNRRPPLYGPRAELNSTRNARLIRTRPASSTHGTRKMIWRSGSQIRSRTAASTYCGCFRSTGPRESKTSRTAWWNSASPGLRRSTSSNTDSSCGSIVLLCMGHRTLRRHRGPPLRSCVCRDSSEVVAKNHGVVHLRVTGGVDQRDHGVRAERGPELVHGRVVIEFDAVAGSELVEGSGLTVPPGAQFGARCDVLQPQVDGCALSADATRPQPVDQDAGAVVRADGVVN